MHTSVLTSRTILHWRGRSRDKVIYISVLPQLVIAGFPNKWLRCFNVHHPRPNDPGKKTRENLGACIVQPLMNCGSCCSSHPRCSLLAGINTFFDSRNDKTIASFAVALVVVVLLFLANIIGVKPLVTIGVKLVPWGLLPALCVPFLKMGRISNLPHAGRIHSSFTNCHEASSSFLPDLRRNWWSSSGPADSSCSNSRVFDSTSSFVRGVGWEGGWSRDTEPFALLVLFINTSPASMHVIVRLLSTDWVSSLSHMWN